MGASKLRRQLLASALSAPAAAPQPATNAVTSTVRQSPAVTLDLIVEAMERAKAEMPHGVLIGKWMGCDVYVDERVPEGEVVVVDPTTNRETMRFRVDHPHLKGTKIEAAARACLASF